uniref:Putative TMV resistance protein N-like n=1 Tax=Davidia involucrata TaxID=16924 RepID=A0A5B7A9X2_DAVIN
MHDLVQEMGQHVVCRDYPKEPGRRSRLWRCEDVCNVLAKNTGSEAIEGIMLDLPNPKDINFSPDAFKKMDNLRLLTVSNANISQGPEYLPNNLRFLNWCGYPSESLPESFEPEMLVELKMHSSHIVHPWKGTKKLHKLEVIDFSHSQKLTGIPNFSRGAPKLERLILEGCRSLVELHPSVNQLHNLKVINCSHLKNLTRTPDFTGIPKLERLILRGCTSLVELHPSINTLTKLRFLNLRDCESLTSLPSSIQLESLEILILDGCFKLQKFPEILGNMECLLELHLGHTAIKELPSSIKHLTGLVLIDMEDCENLTSLPSGICMLKCLEILNLSGCSKLDKLPENLGDMDCLKHLNANGIPLKVLPSSIEYLSIFMTLLTSLPENICSRLKCLENLELSGCSRLDKLPENLWEMECLEVLYVAATAIMRLPSSITHLKNLRRLKLVGHKGMVSQLERQDFRSLVLPAIWSYRTLFVLDLSDCFLLDGAIPNDLGCLCFLQILILSRNNVVSLPGSIRQLSRLEEMYLVGCKSLEAVPEFPSNIQQVCTNDCPSLKSIVVPSTNHRSLSTVSFINCLQLSQNRHGDNMADILLQHMLQGIIFFTDQSSIVVPGREIPQWLGDQNMGCSASTQLLPSWCLCRQHLKGVVVCFVSEFTIVSEIRVRFKFKGHGDRELLSEHSICWKTDRNREINSEHVWLCYAGFTTFNFLHQPDLLCPNELCQFEVTVVDCGGNEMLGIKKCGVRLVYHEGKDRSGSEAVDECTCEIDRNLPRLSKNIIDFHNFDHPIVSEFIERLYLKIRNGKEYRSETSDEKQWSSSSDDILGFAY